jgi:FkbM family methyltransferase
MARGLRINAEGSNVGYSLGTTEPLIQEALAALCQPGWVCYDVGANIGFFSLILGRLVGRAGFVVAAEPLPENVTRLQHNVALNAGLNVRIVPSAIGDDVGTAEFAVAPFSTHGKLRALQRDPATMTAVISVPITTIDEIVATQAHGTPHLIKIDVEGAELAVMRGMRTLLDTARPLLFCEMHGNQPEMARMLEQHAYSYVLSTGPGRLEDAPWYTFVIAAPRERAAVLDPLPGLFAGNGA